MGTKVSEDDEVSVNGKIVRIGQRKRKMVYIAFNKPSWNCLYYRPS